MRKRKSLRRKSRRRSKDKASRRSGVGRGARLCCEADPDAPANLTPAMRRERRRAKVVQDLHAVREVIATQSATIDKLDNRIRQQTAEARSYQALGDTKRRDRARNTVKQTRGQRRNLAGVRSSARSREAALVEQLAKEDALEAAAQAQAVLDATEGDGDDVSTPSTSELHDYSGSPLDDAELEAIGADLQDRGRPPSLTSEEQRELDDFLASTMTFDTGQGATRRRRKRGTRKGKRKGKRSTRKKKRSRRY